MRVQEHLENDVPARGASPLPGAGVSHAGPVIENPTFFEISLSSYPYLADHGFQDMTVLPGSFYIELALRVHESLQATAARIKHVEFRNAVILSERSVTLSIEAHWLDSQTVQYTFRDINEGQHCAVLEIECGQSQENLDAAPSPLRHLNVTLPVFISKRISIIV